MEVSDAIVVGGGISGLTAAYLLKKKGLTVHLFEKAGEAGGKIGTLHKDGFEIDLGPATFRMNAPLRELIQELGLEQELLFPDKKISRKRFIYDNGKLNPISLNPVQLLAGSYLSWNGKRKALKELSYKKGNEATDESIAEFVARHFGEEVLQKLVEPVLTGIYAGDAKQLSVVSVLPILKELENKYGSVIKGFWKERKNMGGGREIAAMRGGLRVFLNKMVDAIGKDAVHYNSDVTSMQPHEGNTAVTVIVDGKSTEYVTKQVVIATPSFHSAQLINSYDASLAQALNTITYNKVWQIHCTVPSEAFKHVLGFGFLVTPSSNKTLLGVVHGGALFKGKAPAGKELLTLFCGGSRWKDQQDPCAQALKDFEDILSAKPEVLNIQEWPDAIPQPGVGHKEIVEKIKVFEAAHKGIHLIGNYRSGVALGDCVKVGMKGLGVRNLSP